MNTRKLQWDAIDELIKAKENGICGCCGKSTHPQLLSPSFGSSEYDIRKTGKLCDNCFDEICEYEYKHNI